MIYLSVKIIKETDVSVFALSFHPMVHLIYIQAFLLALKYPPFNRILTICRALKSLNVNACRVNNTLLFLCLRMKRRRSKLKKTGRL